MGGEERRRRAIAAQGLAAIALFVFAHAAHAAPAPHHAPLHATAVHAVFK
jgi:hypothetical protein